MSIDTRLLKTLLKCITSDFSYPFSICLLFAEVRMYCKQYFFSYSFSVCVFFAKVGIFFCPRNPQKSHSGPILESKSMCAIFQKKGKKMFKKGQNTWKFGQKCTKLQKCFEKRQVIAYDYCT